MAKFKQEQIIPGVTKTRTNAVKVYCSEAISAGDITFTPRLTQTAR